jgi:4-hydroxybenzoate polyprenyltransferase
MVPIAPNRTPALRYLSCLRPQDIFVLQGSPILGALFASRHLSALDIRPLLILIAGNILLVAHVFLLNDLSGVRGDLADPNKAPNVFTVRGVRRREVGGLMTAVLGASLLLFSFLGTKTVLLALSIAILSALYSLPVFNWKGKPILNSIAHLAGGVLHFLLGYSVKHPIDRGGLAIGMFFALIFTAGHLTQEIRDFEGDEASGIRTNAVAFGLRRTFFTSLALFAGAHAVLELMVLRGAVPRVLAAIPALFAIQLYLSWQTFREGFSYDSVSRLQSRYRILYALIGLAMLAAVLLSA